MSILALLASGGAVQIGGTTTPADTFADWLASTAGGNGPTRYWPMDDTSGTTMTADVGGINGTYENTTDLTLNITDAQAEKWVGFGAGAAETEPGHATIVTPLQSAAFTAMIVVQFDVLKPKHVLLTTGLGGPVAGQFSVEAVDDGGGGLKPRCVSVNATPEQVVYVGSNTGTIPIGEWCALFYVRRSNGTQEYWVASAAGVQQTPLTLDSGTPPGSWSAQPAATWFVATGASPTNGVARSLALWNSALSASDINALGAINPQIQNVVWASDLDAGTVVASTTTEAPDISHLVHPEVDYTTSIQTQGSLGTWSVGETPNVLNYDANAVGGIDIAGAYRITKDGINSPNAGLTIEVTPAPNGGGDSDLAEDEPLPTATATLNATTANFDSVYAGAAAGNHIVLANGSYGSKTLNRSFATGNRLVIRAQNLLGATFTGITISGNGQIVSGVSVDGAGVGLLIQGSNVRVTRSRIRNNNASIDFGPGVTDELIDHCEISRCRDRGIRLYDPKNQKRITIARCWVHEMIGGGNLTTNHFFSWAEENVYRERHTDIVVRLNYVGPGEATSETSSDWVHHKSGGYIYAFNHFDAVDLLSARHGLRARWIGNYAPTARFNIYDDLHWFHGNRFDWMRCFAGSYAHYDDVKNLVVSPCFHACKRIRLAGNNSTTLTLGYSSSSNFCTITGSPAVGPDPQPTGGIKPQRTFSGTVYAADDPDHPDVGVKIRAHAGTVEEKAATCIDWVENLSNLPSSAAPGNWLTELLTEFPWISDLCPNPTSLTGGAGGAAPWAVAQGLKRGDATNPNVGPLRDSPGGLP